MRREMTRLYCRFYGGVIFSFALLYIGTQGSVRFLLLLMFSYWLPQIIHSASTGQRHGLAIRYVIFTTVGRLLPVLYFLACPYNIFYSLTPGETRASVLALQQTAADYMNFNSPGATAATSGKQPYMLSYDTAPAFTSPSLEAAFWSNFRFAMLLCIWQGVQVVVLLLQSKLTWGPRFFVPYVFLPAKYNYHRVVEVRDGRVVPNPRATAAWMMHVRPVAEPHALNDDEDDDEDEGDVQPRGQGTAPAAGTAEQPPAANANVTAAVPAAPVAPPQRPLPVRILRYLRRTIRESRRDFTRTSRTWYANGVFFMQGMQQLLEDAKENWRQRRLRGAGGGRGGGSIMGVATSATTSTSLGGGGNRQYARVDDDSSSIHGGESVVSRTSSADLQDAAEAGAVGGASSSPSSSSGGRGSSSSHDGNDVLVGDASYGGIDCVVCMESITFPVRSSTYMVTPCDHMFHTQCLRPWLEQSLQCPTCRLNLPAP